MGRAEVLGRGRVQRRHDGWVAAHVAFRGLYANRTAKTALVGKFKTVT